VDDFNELLVLDELRENPALIFDLDAVLDRIAPDASHNNDIRCMLTTADVRAMPAVAMLLRKHAVPAGVVPEAEGEAAAAAAGVLPIAPGTTAELDPYDVITRELEGLTLEPVADQAVDGTNLGICMDHDDGYVCCY
jgi:hypothetical protein